MVGTTAFALTATMCLGGAVAANATVFTGASGSKGGHSSHSGKTLVVASGQTAVITKTTKLSALTIRSGGALVAPEGYTLTLTVNGVEKGQKVTSTGALETAIVPGTYRGDVVLTVADQTPVVFDGLTYQFREGLYVDADGVDTGKSVLAAVKGRAGDSVAKNISITSKGEAFNGVYVVDTDYTLVNPRISFTGDGRSDFAGMGAGIIGSGDETTLLIDGAKIDNKGVTRPAIIATDGANVIVKNSTIRTADGILPDDYQSSVNLSFMQDAPWMLGISGSNRATNVLGENTQATYISSSITSENWGALSVDSGQNMKLSAINSKVANSGDDGYGTYVIGNADETFLGTSFDVATYATIVTGGSVAYGDSTRAAVTALNTELDLGLSTKEITKLPVRSTTIDSDRFGVMWHGSGSVDISGGTRLTTDETVFLNKGQQATVSVDGSDGAKISTDNGVLYQLMDNDDPGPDFANGMLNTGVYTEPTSAVVKNTSFDVSAVHSTDAVTTFTDISLKGDLYNAFRGDIAGMGPAQPRNLVVTLDGATLKGVVSASTAKHNQSTITSADYRQLGVVTNTAGSVVNNGVIVSLTGKSVWTVTGASYLSSLTVEQGSALKGAGGKAVKVTVDGVATTLVAGTTYTGDIQVSLG
ncbi:hypothetical protein ACFQRL_11370 [Microbacterium fluvii]|uniref:Uncharacterized protein n=1 Tax=Microbacterium fluvii TaxID=415215 RepID=A0ABW2HF10_9MICO|nr:hypothetical protein [Microbacterium fluvii]MCU4673194.1 hypothetical protein [Microbacterium fluvii]